jgi:integrase/recombinase XerD
MRACEAVRADDCDIDPAEAAMTLHGKKRRDRRIALHPTTLEALAGYQQLRDRLIPGYAGPSLLVNTRGYRLDADLTRTHFTHLVDAAGLGALTPRPTLRALRHTFAVTTLTGWLNDDADTQASLPLLSAQLGHAKPRHTFWYLQAVPELLQAASDHMLRAAARAAGGEIAPAPAEEP